MFQYLFWLCEGDLAVTSITCFALVVNIHTLHSANLLSSFPAFMYSMQSPFSLYYLHFCSDAQQWLVEATASGRYFVWHGPQLSIKSGCISVWRRSYLLVVICRSSNKNIIKLWVCFWYWQRKQFYLSFTLRKMILEALRQLCFLIRILGMDCSCRWFASVHIFYTALKTVNKNVLGWCSL